MKKLLYALITVTITTGFLGCATMGTETGGAQQQARSVSAPIVVVASPMVKMDKKATISIIGSGFTPGQELFLLVTDVNGVRSDIGHALKPEPKVNGRGAWYTTWSCGRYISKKLIKEGAYVISVADSDYNPLAQAPVAFYKAKEKEKKK